MIGAGTGIAPLIALLKTRENMNQTSKNWLFFGEQFKASDFYFEKDITSMFDSNHLDKFTTAWSQEGDGYIQDKSLCIKT